VGFPRDSYFSKDQLVVGFVEEIVMEVDNPKPFEVEELQREVVECIVQVGDFDSKNLSSHLNRGLENSSEDWSLMECYNLERVR
jgi:hypothetical protein